MIPFELVLLLGLVAVVYAVIAAVFRDARASRASVPLTAAIGFMLAAVVAIIVACALKADGREAAAKVAEIVGECSLVAGGCLGLIGVVLDRWRRSATSEQPVE